MRLEELMRGDDVIAKRNKAKAEEGSEPRTASQSQPASSRSNGQQERQAEANSTKRKPYDTEEPGETRRKKQGMACLSERAKIEESVKSVSEQLIEEEDKSIRAHCTHEVVEGIIDSLNEVCTGKVMKELSKSEAAQSRCSVDITNANSSLPMTKMAATLGDKSGFVLDGSITPFDRFATTQSLNFARQSDKLMERKKVRAHTSFAVKL